MARRRIIEIGIADKSPVVLAGLRAAFGELGGVAIVFTASDGERFLAALERFPVEVGVIGWEMPYMGGREVLQELARCQQHPPVVVYSGTRDPNAPLEAMELGAAGFVGKHEPPERLLEAIRAAVEGRMTFPRVDLRQIRRDPLAELTRRERELLHALGSGKTNAELARQFGVSVNTIKFHLRNLFDKIGARNRAHAVEIYVRRRGGGG